MELIKEGFEVSGDENEMEEDPLGVLFDGSGDLKLWCLLIISIFLWSSGSRV